MRKHIRRKLLKILRATPAGRCSIREVNLLLAREAILLRLPCRSTFRGLHHGPHAHAKVDGEDVVHRDVDKHLPKRCLRSHIRGFRQMRITDMSN